MDATTTPQADLGEARAGSRIARLVAAALRLLLGLTFTVTGLNGFLNFLPQPKTPIPAGAMALAGAFMQSGYLFQLVAGTQLAGGLLLLSNRFVPLGLILLAPVIVNIFAFHAFLAPSGLGIASALVLVEAWLAWAYRDAFRPVLAMRAAPGPR